MIKEKEKTIVDKVLSVVVDQNISETERRVRISTTNGKIRLMLRLYPNGEMHVVAENGTMTIGKDRPYPSVIVT